MGRRRAAAVSRARSAPSAARKVARRRDSVTPWSRDRSAAGQAGAQRPRSASPGSSRSSRRVARSAARGHGRPWDRSPGAGPDITPRAKSSTSSLCQGGSVASGKAERDESPRGSGSSLPAASRSTGAVDAPRWALGRQSRRARSPTSPRKLPWSQGPAHRGSSCAPCSTPSRWSWNPSAGPGPPRPPPMPGQGESMTNRGVSVWRSGREAVRVSGCGSRDEP